MKITISQENSSPISITVPEGERSNEALSGAEIANSIIGNNPASNVVKTAGYTLARGTFNGIGKSLLAALGSIGLGTLWTSLVSCGTFNTGNEIAESPKCKARMAKFLEKHKSAKDVTPEEVKNDPRAKTKSGFWNWVFAGNVSGKKVMEIPKHDVLVKKINGVTIAVTTLSPFFGSVDLRQFAGQKVAIVTGFYKNLAGKIVSKNLCRAYLGKGGKINKSGESFNDVGEISIESFIEPIIEEMREEALESYYNLTDR